MIRYSRPGFFLAIGPQIYVDGLVVVDGKVPVGRIGSHHLIRFIIDHPDRWTSAVAADIMLDDDSVLDAAEPLEKALNIFKSTRFAFVPVSINESVATTLSLRDSLRVGSYLLKNLPAYSLASQLVSVSGDISIGKSLEIMLEKGIRNLGVVERDTNLPEGIKVVNDRKILEFLMSHEGNNIIATMGTKGLYGLSVMGLDLPQARMADKSITASAAAELLADVGTPCLMLSGDKIITPWDVIIKGLLAKSNL